MLCGEKITIIYVILNIFGIAITTIYSNFSAPKIICQDLYYPDIKGEASRSNKSSSRKKLFDT